MYVLIGFLAVVGGLMSIAYGMGKKKEPDKTEEPNEE